MSRIRAWASQGAKQPLTAYEYDPGPLKPEEVEVAVEYCGVCHSDLSVVNDEWGVTKYPVVPGHEVVGRVTAVGAQSRGLRVGQRVGVGWTAESCMHCRLCLGGDQNLCAEAVPTMLGGHRGGFAERVRAHWAWTIPLPETLDITAAGPLLCGGITVFAPLVNFGIKPTDRVGVVGIGGLGHMAIKFARAWGCDVTAFTSSASKYDEARGFGHHVVSSRDSKALAGLARSLDLLMITVNVPLDWAAMLATVAPKGRMHVLGAVLEPIPVSAMDLIMTQRSVSGSPTGAPVTIAAMFDFAARHNMTPQVEHFPMSKVNEALAHLEAGKARYRIVLDADFK